MTAATQPADIWTPTLRWPPMSDDEADWFREYEDAGDTLSPTGDAAWHERERGQ